MIPRFVGSKILNEWLDANYSTYIEQLFYRIYEYRQVIDWKR